MVVLVGVVKRGASGDGSEVGDRVGTGQEDACVEGGVKSGGKWEELK